VWSQYGKYIVVVSKWSSHRPARAHDKYVPAWGEDLNELRVYARTVYPEGHIAFEFHTDTGPVKYGAD
jgi:hypothetical protein